MIDLPHLLILSALLFALGLGGLFARRRALLARVLALTLMGLAAALNLAAFGWHHGAQRGEMIAALALCVVVAQLALGLAILLCIFRNRGTLHEDAPKSEGETPSWS